MAGKRILVHRLKTGFLFLTYGCQEGGNIFEESLIIQNTGILSFLVCTYWFFFMQNCTQPTLFFFFLINKVIVLKKPNIESLAILR